ncbi:MAG: hypothetical protein Q4A62_04625 [Eikenella sp.]|nr:hypothetical protein [Eikenella sp.]
MQKKAVVLAALAALGLSACGSSGSGGGVSVGGSLSGNSGSNGGNQAGGYRTSLSFVPQAQRAAVIREKVGDPLTQQDVDEWYKDWMQNTGRSLAEAKRTVISFTVNGQKLPDYRPKAGTVIPLQDRLLNGRQDEPVALYDVITKETVDGQTVWSETSRIINMPYSMTEVYHITNKGGRPVNEIHAGSDGRPTTPEEWRSLGNNGVLKYEGMAADLNSQGRFHYSLDLGNKTGSGRISGLKYGEVVLEPATFNAAVNTDFRVLGHGSARKVGGGSGQYTAELSGPKAEEVGGYIFMHDKHRIIFGGRQQ